MLVRNHELTADAERRAGDAAKAPVPHVNPYDDSSIGGTTGLVVGPNRKLAESFVTNSGTSTNCAQHRWAPKVSAELREYAAKNDMSPYEAAAYERLGVTLV
ncbi:MAG: hypothetical protein M3356_04325 [Actinomycetota bacterium]|nr:hypothetical protein [Actinomycetota bacterium]